jgi:hypothetical protein
LSRWIRRSCSLHKAIIMLAIAIGAASRKISDSAGDKNDANTAEIERIKIANIISTKVPQKTKQRR